MVEHCFLGSRFNNSTLYQLLGIWGFLGLVERRGYYQHLQSGHNNNIKFTTELTVDAECLSLHTIIS